MLSEQSTKEEVADYFSQNFKIDEKAKNNLIKEDISGDILLEIPDPDFKSFGIKVGPLKKIAKFLATNKDKFKKKEIKEKITIASNSEEVKNFFENSLNFKGNLNGLDGKGLIELDEEGMKKLGLNYGQRKKLIKYIEYFKTLKVDEPVEDIIVTKESTEEEVSKFLKMRLKFSQESIDSLGLDGDSLFMLEETEIEQMDEITQEEKDNLKKFLSKEKLKEPEKKEEGIIITNQSSENEVANFLKNKMGLKDEVIGNLALDGESLFQLTDEDIDDLQELTQEEKEKLKQFLNENKQEKDDKQDEKKDEENKEKDDKKDEENKEKDDKKDEENKEKDDKKDEENKEKDNKKDEENKEKEPKDNKDDEKNLKKESDIKITKDTKKEDIIKFLKEKLKLEKEEEINSLEEKEIDKISEISKNEKDILKNFLKEENGKNPKKKLTTISDILYDDKLPLDSIKNSPNNIKNKNKNNIQNKANNEKEKKKMFEIDVGNETKLRNAKQNIPDKNKKNKNKVDDPLSNKPKEEKLEKEEKKDKNIKYKKMENCKVQEILKDSKYNIFFLLIIQEKYIKNLELSTFYNNSGILSSSYINYDFHFIYEQKLTNPKGESVKCYIVQVPLDKPIKQFSVYLLLSTFNKYNKIEYRCIIDIKSETNNYFYVYNLIFDRYNDFTQNDMNNIFNIFLSYFFNKKKNELEPYQKGLIEALATCISKSDKAELLPETILMIFKFCSIFQVKLDTLNIDVIEIKKDYKNKKTPLDHDYCLLNEDIDKLILKKQKPKLIDLIVNIYANYDKEYLMKLIQCKDNKNYCRSVFDLLNKNTLKLKDLSFKNEEESNVFQKNLLSVSKTKDEVNFVIKLSKGFTNSLIFINENFLKIYSILEENASKFSGEKSNYHLSLGNLGKEDNDFQKIYVALSGIIKSTQEKKNKILNLEEIFDNMVYFYYNKELNEFCKLHNIIGLLKTQRINAKNIENYYNQVHQKGMNLIRMGKFKTEDIINFMLSQDIYYFNPVYNNDKTKKDPEIFNFIQITDNDKNYLNNIKLIKENKLWDFFSNSDYYIQRRFIQIYLEQMKKIKDFIGFFEIFPIKIFNQDFTFLINGKIEQIIFTALNEKENIYDSLFSIFDNWLICNEYNGLDLNYITNILAKIKKFTSKYYFYLLKNQNMTFIANKIKNNIMNFFLWQEGEGNDTAETLISLLLLSHGSDLCLYFLNQLNNKILTEKDFYQKDENQKFLLFKLFFEKCGELIQNPAISQGYYLEQSLKIKIKISNDLISSNVRYDMMDYLIDENNSFLKKIQVICENDSQKIYDNLKKNIEICKNKLEKLELIQDYYISFFSTSKYKIINLIRQKLIEIKQKNIIKIIKKENFFIDNQDFNFEQVLEESKNIKYKNSIFFLSIYSKKKDTEGFEKSEEQLFKESINSYNDTLTRIINQKESKEPFFTINFVDDIMKATQKENNDMNKEIGFIQKEFAQLQKDDYIKNHLLNDLTNFSKKEKVSKILQGIIYFIESFTGINEIKKTQLLENFKKAFESISSDNVSGEEIKTGIDLLKKYDYDVNNETSLIKFYELLLGKDDSLSFLKKIKDLNFEIRNLNEFIDENESSELQTTDIDNLMDVYRFFNKLMDNKEIDTDEKLLKNFKEEFNNVKNKDIIIKIEGYLKTYGEIIQLFDSYHENPEMTIQKIDKLLNNSSVKLYKDEKLNLYSFNIQYKNQKDEYVEADIKELEELRNKILMSSTNTNILKKDGDNNNEQNNKVSKAQITNEFVNLIDNIKQLNKTLNSLLKSGYPLIINLYLKVKNSQAYDKNNSNRDLQKIIEDYKSINKSFKNSIKEGYIQFPILRLFYGQQFISLYEKANNKDIDISYLVNSVTLNKIKDMQLQYQFDERLDNMENINEYLVKLFNKNNVTIEEIYKNNVVKKNSDFPPGLYRKIKTGDSCDLINNILNIYLNATDNPPIINTLLICNEDTTIEKIQSFLYRAIFCEKPILFLICNMECLELYLTQNIIKTLKNLYKMKNRNINSYLLFLYEKVDSGLVRDIEKLIPEKNILDNSFMKPPQKKIESLEKIELYSSKYSGYGKTTEIIYEVKGKGGRYYYLPIGGSFTRNYVINNLENLHLDLQNGDKSYLHLDLSETDNDDLINEILFKLIILRYVDSNEKIFYLGYDIHLIIEIPKGFIEFDKKYKILKLFKKINIEELKPLRLEENIQYIRDSPISIVAEVLSLYDNNQIGTKNIDLDAPIQKNAVQCEKIINKHFQVENQNYYQKMNFIKILSIQFKKFTENPFFNYEMANLDGKGEIIKKARIAVIKNFIALTKVFTRSPFDTVLLRQIQSMEMFGKYDENKAKEDGVMALADEKQKSEIFSFEQIKPSLVFFNRDGGSLSIITNNNKNDKEYKDLKELWNSQNLEFLNAQYPGQAKMEDLVDYKNMQHEKFLEQIKKLFSLDKLEIKDLQKICEESGNYIFVSDNFIKMVRILLNIEAKIPVILMGETGVGKTKLLEMLATLYGKGELRWERLQIHAGTTDQKIVSFIEEVTEKVKKEGKENELTWIFFDEINTCNSLGLITEIMCNHTYLGKKINDNFVFLGACNPYRILTKRMRESGLVYYNMKEKSKLNNLVYTVNPLPHALLNFVFDFGSLQEKDERKYIKNTIESIIKRIQRDGLINNINNNDLGNITNEIIESIAICHDFIREKYDKSSVSMREIRRFGIFFEYFIKNTRSSLSPYTKMKLSLNMTLYLCYYLRLNDKKYREELASNLQKFYKDSNFLRVPEYHIKKVTKEMTIEKSKGIALNRALKENLFTCFTCIDNNVPLIIVGKPGTGKSLSFQILYNTLKGEYSDSPLFRTKGKLYRYYYQGSETSTAEGIEQVFNKASNAQKKNKNKNIITLVFFDEMGLAERSSNNPLKVIHYLLEKDSKDSVPFLGISNWRLDAAKINRALSLTITDYDIKDLQDTAISIAEALDENLSKDYKDFFETLAKTYKEYTEFNQSSIKENKDFHGNRDFYNLIKTAMRELIQRRKELPKNENKILTEVGLLSLNRNFGGLENSDTKIKEIFKQQYKHKFDENANLESNFSVLDAIKKNIVDPNSRYLMLISEGNDGSDIVKYLLNSLDKKFIELVGSKYKSDIKSGKYSEEILNKIKYIMETDNVLILRDLDMIYASLYDLFNQNFTIMGDKKFARIAFEYAKISSEVNKDFHAIVIVNKDQINNLKLDPPFLNRFEKHIVSFNMLLEEKDIEIANKITEYIDLISSFNNNKNLKIDLEKLLINCKQHNIEGLIFKIKNEKLKNENEEWVKKEGPEYEDNMIKAVLNKIVPTFCQDIIASMISSNISESYDNMKNIVLDIYKKSKCNNFESFFKKIESKKNIIYTFSKVTENLFEEDKNIENKFGIFNEKSTNNLLIQSFKCENDLIFSLKLFNNSQTHNLLVIRFTENDLNKINSVNYVINNFQKENPKIEEKLIIFIIHKQRMSKGEKVKKVIIPDLISFINDDYYQIFIDNLQGKENLDILSIMQKNNEELVQEYLQNSNFIENKIFYVLNYMKYTMFFETKDLNKKNYTTEVAKRIIKSKGIRQLIIHNLKKQGKSIKKVIKDVFVTDIIEVNDVDFFEVISTKLNSDFCLYLLNIILHSLKENILNQLLINPNFDLLMQNDFFSNLINNVFDKSQFRFIPPVKMNINANKITIYNGLVIPKSKSFLDLIIKYINDELSVRYLKIEESLRKKITKQEKIDEEIKNYNKQMETFEKNIKTEINKYDFFKQIFNQNNEELKKMITNEYIKYFIINYIEKKEMNDFEVNEKLIGFLQLIIKIKLSDSHNHHYDFENTIEEFIKIMLFTQGYKDDIKNFLDIYVEIYKYCNNIDDLIIKVLDENIIKYEISERNKKYTEIVNIHFFNIFESLLRAILLYSIELKKQDKAKFFEYFYSLTLVEAILQRINKKFYLFSKELYNIRYIIKIEEGYKSNHEQFENNYEKIMNNLLQQSTLLYSENYKDLYTVIKDLIKLFDETFTEKNDKYNNLLFFIFRQQYKNINSEEIRVQLLEDFFNNKLLLKKSKIFLSETLKDLKPEIIKEVNKKKVSEDSLIKNFMNLDNKKLEKYKNIIEICNKNKSSEFDEIL